MKNLEKLSRKVAEIKSDESAKWFPTNKVRSKYIIELQIRCRKIVSAVFKKNPID